jgi:hypothetical protein
VRTQADASSPLNVSRFALHQSLPPRACNLARCIGCSPAATWRDWRRLQYNRHLAMGRRRDVRQPRAQPGFRSGAGNNGARAGYIELPPTSAERGEIALTFDDGPDAEVTPRVLESARRIRRAGDIFLRRCACANLPAHRARNRIARACS